MCLVPEGMSFAFVVVGSLRLETCSFTVCACACKPGSNVIVVCWYLVGNEGRDPYSSPHNLPKMVPLLPRHKPKSICMSVSVLCRFYGRCTVMVHR